jgi:hypothetical protein
MMGIRSGFENGLTFEQVKLFADERFDWEQMIEIRLGFENGLTFEQIAVYADKRFHWKKMWAIRGLLEKEPDGKSARLLVAGLNKEIF